ncbi:MAG: family 20 glycosylhydrolase [Victivallales bacterium]|nr:family 20 glycosylhydrolase [Victivallales bacterium]
MKFMVAPVIGVQLDLGRQKETLEFIESFIDFIAANGFNTLYLHLESGVRTTNFAFADPEQSYSPAEIRRIVAYAQCRGISPVPVIATLGHAENFLRHPELAQLAEQRNANPETRRTEFCPSLSATYEFLESFIRELAELFPGDAIHVGGDEVFDLASCDICLRRLEQGESRADLFLDHLKRIHNLVVGQLGRKMIIWDDMADFLPEILDHLPRDIGLVFWEYETVVEGKLTKFGNRARIDIFRRYEELGILEYYAAPRELQLSNITSMTDYARRYRPTGMFLTVWEHRCDFMYRFYPQIAYAGRLWRDQTIDQEEQVFAGVICDLFGIDDPPFTAAVRAFANSNEANDPWINTASDFRSGIRKSPNYHTNIHLDHLELIRQVLASRQTRIKHPLGQRILDDLLVAVDEHIGTIRAHLWINAALKSRLLCSPIPSVEPLRKDLHAVQTCRSEQWRKFRPDLPMTPLLARQKQQLQTLEQYQTLWMQFHAVVEVSFMLPDFWGRQQIEVQLRQSGDKEYITILAGMPKPADPGEQPYYVLYAPVTDLTAEELKISSYGYNGIGVVYARLLLPGGESRIPIAISEVTNLVTNPDNLLKDDSSWTMFGNRDGLNLFFDRASGAIRHEVTLKLGCAKVKQ